MESVYSDAQHLPLSFWACGILLLLLCGYALHQNRAAWALPCLAVLGTTGVWYLGDILYSGIGPVAKLFPAYIIDRALWQVMLFLVAYGVMCREVSRWFVRDREDATPLFDQPDIFGAEAAQDQIAMALWFSIAGWAIIFLVGLARTGFPVKASLFPFLAGQYAELWERDRLGGATGFLISTGYYIHIFFCAMFGGIFTLARRPRLRVTAAVFMALTWPYWLFGYGRNVVLVIGIPAACGFFFFSRQRLLFKVGVMVTLFLAVNLWFKFTLATRHDAGIAETFAALISGESSTDYILHTKHLGLDMFKELCYMNRFIEKETYGINWGKGYLAEAVNIVPRSLWPGKPTIGIEFSIARGSLTKGMGSELVSYIVTTGMIGQGVENFGFILGPIAAAFLMSLWSGVLALFWTQRRSVLRACLFLMGLGLTFNTGRNITLQVFFPFLFGYLIIRLYEWHQARRRLVATP